MIYIYLINIIDKLFYGCIYDFCFVKFMSCIMNYSLIAIFFRRIKHQKGTLEGIICTSAITLGIYNIIPESAGMSTVWSFCYGSMDKKDIIDHFMFWIPCVFIVIPWSLHNIVYSWFSFRLWPYDVQYIYIATFAHLLFAYIGYIYGKVYRKYLLE